MKKINGYFDANNMLESLTSQFFESCGSDDFAKHATKQYRKFLVDTLVRKYLEEDGRDLSDFSGVEKQKVVNESLCEIVNEYRAEERGVSWLQEVHVAYLAGGEATLSALYHSSK